jgi:hypothetical protein
MSEVSHLFSFSCRMWRRLTMMSHSVKPAQETRADGNDNDCMSHVFHYYDEICFNSPLRNELPIYNKAIGVPVAGPVSVCIYAYIYDCCL